MRLSATSSDITFNSLRFLIQSIAALHQNIHDSEGFLLTVLPQCQHVISVSYSKKLYLTTTVRAFRYYYPWVNNRPSPRAVSKHGEHQDRSAILEYKKFSPKILGKQNMESYHLVKA
jgi:hypothetical protein